MRLRHLSDLLTVFKGLFVLHLSWAGAGQGAKVHALAEFLEAPKRLSDRDQAASVRARGKMLYCRRSAGVWKGAM